MNDSKTKKSVINLFKSKKVNIGFIFISYIIIIYISVIRTQLEIENFPVRPSREFTIGMFLGSILGISIIPAIISLIIFIIKKFILKKENITFKSIYSVFIFIMSILALLIFS